MPILTPEERLGQCIAGRYRLDTVLFTGGMGVLFRAVDEVTGRGVAVKMLKPVYSLDQDRVARFLRETRIAATIRHPNIAAVLDVGQDDTGIPFLVIELLRGRSLQQELDLRGSLPLAETLAIVLPIANALDTAHALGVIHRDVKPGNIFLGRDASGRTVPKLLDFGIAKSPKDDFETETGLVVGTPGYMAPEQAQHGQCGPFTDIWAVGAVLYRCLSGRAPHAGSSVPEVLAKLVREPVPPLVAPDVKNSICATIDRALAQDSHRRYVSMAAFARALETAAGSESHEDATDVMPAVTEPGVDALQGGSNERAGNVIRSVRAGAWFSWRGVGVIAGTAALMALIVGGRKGHERQFGNRSTQRAIVRLDEPTIQVAPRTPPVKTLPPAFVPAEEPAKRRTRPGASDLPSGSHPTPTKAERTLYDEPFALKSPAPPHHSSSRAVMNDVAPASRPVEREPTTGLPVATEW